MKCQLTDLEAKQKIKMQSVDKKREIFGLFYLAAAIFLAVIFYIPASRTGWLGETIRQAAAGLFGTVVLALPVIFLYMSIDYFFGRQLKITRQRFTAVLLCWFTVSVLIALFSHDQNIMKNLILEENGEITATGAIRQLWFWGSESIGSAAGLSWSGGLSGGLLAQALRSIIGQTGAMIFTICMILALLVLIFNLSFSRMLYKTADTFSRTQDLVSKSVSRHVNEIRQHRDVKINTPQIRRVNGNSYDLPLPTSYQSTETSKKQGIYKPDYSADDSVNMTEDFHAGDPVKPDQSNETTIETDPDDNSNRTFDQEPAAAAHEWPKSNHSIAESTSTADADSSSIDSIMMLKSDHDYIAPTLDLLRDDRKIRHVQMHTNEIKALGTKLERTLASFKVEAKVVNFTTGPTITRFELTPGLGVKVSKIVSLADDIALNLAAMGVRIEAPIPGKAAIGIEIPNKETTSVLLRGLLESPEFQQSKSPLTAALGRDVQGNPIFCDLAAMPHLLIAGATGSGKSVCINCILMSLLYKARPEQLRLLMIDPKVVELNVYNGIPHLIQPVVTDPKKAYGVLSWAVNEMVRRYALFAERAVRDIHSYNAALELDLEDDSSKLPLILLVIDELSDLMATTPNEVEDAIARLTAMARAAGIHLIIATQRPSVDVITGVIKANIPSRIAFSVASHIDSRTILDIGGAEKLLGKGDMLYYPQNASKPIRGQGAFISDAEVERVLLTIKSQNTANYDDEVAAAISAVPIGKNKEKEKESPGEQDELLPQALGIVVETGYASVSLLQRRMTVGYPRAARLIDRLHEMGYIGPFEGSKPRRVLISMTQYLEMQQTGEEQG